MWNLKYDTNEPTCRTETDPQTKRTGLWLYGGEGGGEESIGNLELTNANSYIYRMDKQQGPTVSYRKLYSISISHYGKEYDKEYIYTHTHITKSLCCTAEINTTL